MDYLTLEYFMEKGLSLSQAAVALEAVCSCAIENPKCSRKETVDNIIDIILKGDLHGRKD